MLKRIKKRYIKNGFTLMEMLVVVAIIIILLVIAIPSFKTALAKAKKAACDENLNSVNHTYVAEALLDNEHDYENDLEKSMKDSKGNFISTSAAEGKITAKCDGLCPSDGEYTVIVDESTGEFLSGICSVHGSEEEKKPTTVTGLEASTNLKKAFENLANSFVNSKFNFSTSRTFDSNGLNRTPEILKELKNLGYDLDENSMWKIVTKADPNNKTGAPSEFCIYIADLTAEQKKLADENPGALKGLVGTQIYVKDGVITDKILDANLSFKEYTNEDKETYSVISNMPGRYK